MTILDILNQQFNAQVSLQEKRAGVQQLYAPLFHEDGDMMDIYLDIPRDFEANGKKTVRISDHGMTIMRLSYSFEIDTPNTSHIANSPVPADRDEHADADSGSMTLKWSPALASNSAGSRSRGQKVSGARWRTTAKWE